MDKKVMVGTVLLVLALAVTAPSGAMAGQGPGPGSADTAKAQTSKKHKKKKKRKKRKKQTAPAPPVIVPPPAPLALTETEVRNQVTQKAGEYCSVDPDCYDYGYYTDGLGQLDCSSKSTYSWTCYGWNDEDDGVDLYTCDFREVVERSGYSSVVSHQDLGYGWNCF